jgi:hypothetical protein
MKAVICITKRNFLCGGGLAYLHYSLARRRRRRNGSPVPGGITGPPCQWGIKIQGPGPQGWGLDAKLAILLCKKNCRCKI